MMRRSMLLVPVIAGLTFACQGNDGDDTGDASSSGMTEPATTTPTTGEPEQPTSTSGESATITGSTSDPSSSTSSTDTGPDETTEEPPTPVDWSFDADLFGRANADDDDANGKDDWFDGPFASDNELAAFVLPATTLNTLPPGSQVRLNLAGATDQVRAWLDGEVILGHDDSDGLLEHTLTPRGDDITLAFEFADHNVRATLTLTWLDADNTEVETATVNLWSSPLITNHHLQPVERAWIVNVNGGGNYNNQAMIQAIVAEVGDLLTLVPAQQYDGDVWIQDEFEWATTRSGDGERMDVVIDSIRDRGLDPLPENTLVGPDYIAQTWGMGPKTTFDSFGNLEASPPVTVNGKFYPFGRIYYGAGQFEGIDKVFAQKLIDQEIQEPFELDSTWLCVAHVDEFSTFVPDPTSPKGFRLLLADIPAMYELLDSLPGNLQISRYGQPYGYQTVAQLRDDNGLRAYNFDIQQDHMTEMRAVFKQELGLDDSDIIEIPSIFEHINNCGAASLVPGSVNLALFNVEGQPRHTFVPDPFLRPNGAPQADDPAIIDFRNRMPESLTVHFVDNWRVYHLNLGEVHCGTNVQRTPIANWWEEN